MLFAENLLLTYEYVVLDFILNFSLATAKGLKIALPADKLFNKTVRLFKTTELALFLLPCSIRI